MKPVSGKRIASILEQNGWTLKRIKGSHHIYSHKQKGIITVPIHSKKDLKRGTQKSIMKQADISEDML